ncbi:Peptidase M20C, Xaa-His dipeptidase [Candidatus Koribacter versatilis Ellin345]|uniref:Cytosol non-specific dipeptidase n=1 Tax=Koribacter versatilis (strain Ellin345) TaxID=204669 RepID=Q1IRJ4_KORVE|nr:aminoacyl-histidine dipeptidase [Candidatus Koribacter versatilis]ABF40506.1 Peptidase M20C, Xaa-His dipeptidase [Candidatus Koribacter versatilis Ellin345]
MSSSTAVAVAELEPKAIWKHFEALTKIPRPSTKEDAARKYVIGIAEKHGLKHVMDAAGNLVVSKPATKGREHAPMAALQGHLDMVCEKNEGTHFDFDKDAIKVIRGEDWLYADGTTLGSDNGVGVATALAVMESKDIAHGPLEFVFTIDEETGLTGASDFQPGLLKSKYFLNLDGEEKGTLCIGCAGGVNTPAHRKVTKKAAPAGTALRVKVSGLKGGHSGVDIHLGRGNAVRILGRVLETLLRDEHANLADIKGGSAHNAIPREAYAVVVIDPKREEEVKTVVARIAEDVKAELGAFDPDVKISVENVAAPKEIMEHADATKVADLLATVHHGVLAMSPDIKGLVQTSTNLATVSLNGDTVEVVTSQRSSIESSKNAIARMVAALCKNTGFHAEHTTGYPGWKPEPNSDIVKISRKVHEEVLGKDPELVAMHAGLECGVIGEKHHGMQMISFGPQIENPHSPNERVQISSVESFWKFLRVLLERI